MKDVLRHLVALQHLDDRLAVLRRRLQSLPEELGGRRTAHAVLEAEADAIVGDRKSCLGRAQDLENDVRTAETRVAKLEDQIRNTRDAGAVKVAEHEAEELRGKISEAEDEALRMLEKAEALVKEHATAVEKARDSAAELEKFTRTVEEDQTDLEQQIAALDKERAAIAGQVPRDALEVYDKLKPSRKGRSLAVLKGDSCAGCGMVVPPNDRVKVVAMSSLARCRSCARILILAEIWSPQAAGAEADAEKP